MIVTVGARYLPFLGGGTIFDAGHPIGRLNLVRREIRFDPSRDVQELTLADESPIRPPNWSFERCPVVPKRYGFAPKSRAAVILADGITFVIPAYVIVQRLLATSDTLVKAMLEQPWDMGLQELVELDSCGPDAATGITHVVLKKNLRPSERMTVAMLLPGLNDAGAAAARAIHASILARGVLPARLPYGPGPMSLTVSGFWLYRDRMLALSIDEAPWAGPSRLQFVAPGRSVGAGGDPKSRDFVQRDTLDVDPDGGGDLEVVSDENPADEGDDAALMAPATTFHGMPEATVVRGPDREVEGPMIIRNPVAIATRASAGAPPGSPDVGHIGATQSAWLGPCQRFERLAEALDDLVATGRIVRWDAVPPSSNSRLRGTRAVWALPIHGRSRWAFVDLATRTGRTAMVCAIRRLDRSLVYWVEIEFRANEPGGSKALIFACEAPNLEGAVQKLLRQASEHRGVWTNTRRDAPKIGITRFSSYVHRTNNDGDLVRDSVLDALSMP